MTTYTSFDPREAFRQNLGTAHYDEDGNSNYCLTITGKHNQTEYIPIYLSEEIKTEELPCVPCMEMHIPPGGTTYEPHDIAAATRKIKSFIIIHVWFTNTDYLTPAEFAKKIKDQLHNLVRNNQSSTTGITFMNIEDDGFNQETKGRQVLFHYEITLYCLYYDLC